MPVLATSNTSTQSQTTTEFSPRFRRSAEWPKNAWGKQIWLAQGFHRYAARRAAGFDDIECEVIQGKRADAILDAVGSNATHGVRRTNADKRHAVLMLLGNKTWAKRTDRWIADACGVGHQLVGDVRKQLDDSSTGQNGEGSNLPKITPDGRVHLPAREA